MLEVLLAIFAIIALPALAGEQNKVPIVAVAWQLLLISSVLWLAGGFIGPRLTWLGLRRGCVQLLLVLSLGLCLMTGMLFSKANLSPAFGAFIVGMLLAETTEITKIRLLVTPIKHLFMAVFFVAFGMQFQASQITSGFLPAIILIPWLILAISHRILDSFNIHFPEMTHGGHWSMIGLCQNYSTMRSRALVQ